MQFKSEQLGGDLVETQARLGEAEALLKSMQVPTPYMCIKPTLSI
jgi:hypothetical protein